MALNFSSDGTNITINGEPVTGNFLGSFDIPTLEQRFAADIVKDGSIPGAQIDQTSLRQIIQSCFGITLERGNFHNILDRIEQPLTTNNNITRFETILKNILKTSTVGSNTLISDSQFVFWESGFATKNICRTTPTTVGTPASILDSINKEEPNIWFPGPGQQITFDARFSQRMGFPAGLTWSCQGLENGSYNVTINYGNGVEITSPIRRGNRGDFQPYSEGNKEKNMLINGVIQTRGVSNSDCAEYKKILITKELGDVAQIWLYLAFVLTKIPPTDRTQALMITVDSVVYLFCKILFLACVYTGSREGVTTGGCTLKHFLPGDIDYKQKLKNMMDIYYTRTKSHNSAIKQGLLIMGLDQDSFVYFKKGRNPTNLIRTFGSSRMTREQKLAVSNLLNRYAEVVGNYNAQLEVIYNTTIETVDTRTDITDDTPVTAIYNEFCRQVDQQKSPQYITKSDNFILNPSQLLVEFANIMGILDQMPENLNDFIANARNGVIQQQGGRYKRKRQTIKNNKNNKNNKKGGSDLDFNGADCGYYECLFLVYIYIVFFQGFKVRDIPMDVFAVIYDCVVWELRNDTNPFLVLTNLGLTDEGFIIINGHPISDEDIVSLGSQLSRYINFAKDADEEDIILNNIKNSIFLEMKKNMSDDEFNHNWNALGEGIMERTAESSENSMEFTRFLRSNKFMNGEDVPMPSLYCDGKKDVITSAKIRPGHAIYLNGKCYDITNFISAVKTGTGMPHNQGIWLDPYTRLPFSEPDQAKINSMIGLLLQYSGGKRNKSIRKRRQRKSTKTRKSKKN